MKQPEFYLLENSGFFMFLLPKFKSQLFEIIAPKNVSTLSTPLV
jgi:hypothetical protein